MDSDKRWFEDRNDDIIDSKWVNDDGSFKISFDAERVRDRNRLEGKPDIYLIVRNSSGQIVHTTEVRKEVEANDMQNLTFNIVLESVQKSPLQTLSSDPYSFNNERVIAAFGQLTDVSEFQVEDIIRIFRLLQSSVNAWSLYTTEYMWSTIGYDGPQVPRYPWRQEGHSHKLAWEKGTDE